MSKKVFSVPVEIVFKGTIEVYSDNSKEARQIAKKRTGGLMSVQIDDQYNDIKDWDISMKPDEVHAMKCLTKIEKNEK